MNLYFDLFLTFAKVGVCTFGGGYAMLPILQREVVEKKGWATEADLADYYAVGQCTPGIIAVNTATFVGSKSKGILGGIVATLGVVFPSVVIITIIAAFLQQFAQIQWVAHAFAGVRAGVCALILSSILKLRKNTLIDAPTILVFLFALALALIGNFAPIPTDIFWGKALDFLCSPVIIVLLSGLAGLCIQIAKGGFGK